MRSSMTAMAGLAAVALMLAACSSSTSSLPPLVTPAPTVAPSAAVAVLSASVAAPSASVAAPPTSVAAPPAPTNFTATRKSGSVPCPANGPDSPCSQVDFAWQASTDPGSGFTIYVAATGEGPDATCLTAQANATVRLGVKPASRSAQAFDPMVVGGGQICYWITAVNFSAESGQVAAAGN